MNKKVHNIQNNKEYIIFIYTQGEIQKPQESESECKQGQILCLQKWLVGR